MRGAGGERRGRAEGCAVPGAGAVRRFPSGALRAAAQGRLRRRSAGQRRHRVRPGLPAPRCCSASLGTRCGTGGAGADRGSAVERGTHPQSGGGCGTLPPLLRWGTGERAPRSPRAPGPSGWNLGSSPRASPSTAR